MLIMSEAKEMLKERFHMKDLGRLSYFLGIHFEQGDRFVKMNQNGYITKVLERFEMSNCKPRSTPSEQKLEFDGETPVDPRRYREAVGSLVYAMTCTRPDICWVVTKLSQFLIAPIKGHWIALKHVLRYLKETLDFELCYRKCGDGLTLIGYSNAVWASSTDDRRSIVGTVSVWLEPVILFLGNQGNNQQWLYHHMKLSTLLWQQQSKKVCISLK